MPPRQTCEAFAPTGDVKGIWVPFQESHGVIILAYYDIRHATQARSLIANQAIPGLEETRISLRNMSTEQIERVGALKRLHSPGRLIRAACAGDWKVNVCRTDGRHAVCVCCRPPLPVCGAAECLGFLRRAYVVQGC